MTGANRYSLVIAPPAKRTLSEKLAFKIAMAAWEFIDGALRDNPQRVGHRLQGPFAGHWSARRSTYRVRYRIDEASHTVIVLDVAGRADAYHPGRA